MKKLFYLLLVLSFISFYSCEKEKIDEDVITEVNGIQEHDTVSIYGKFLLLSGKMYVTNLETNQKTVYDHFNNTKTISSLSYYGSTYPIERIEKNKTTWEITPPPYVPGDGEFILNNDTLDPYAFHVTVSNWTIIEHPLTGNYGITQKMGGSARPLNGYLINKADSTVMFMIQEEYTNIDGYNCKYVSELMFKKIK